jgi:hypothetical protein
MKPLVIDTDVASFLFKNDSRTQSYLPHLLDRQSLISFMTEAELEQWALLSNWQARSSGCESFGAGLWSSRLLADQGGVWKPRMSGSRRPPVYTMLRSSRTTRPIIWAFLD